MSAAIVVVRELRPRAGSGCLKALADVQIGPFLLRSCRIVQQVGQRAYVQLPQVQDTGGRWFPALSCNDRDLDQEIKSVVLTAWGALQEGGAR